MTQNYTVKLKSKEDIARDTISFSFEKPEGFTFRPGQYGDFALLNPKETDAEGNTRSFSFVSTPSEPDIKIAMRIRDTAFKRSLKELPIGSKVSLRGPLGGFTLQGNASIPAVFIAGGIGLTPARSMIKFALDNNLPHTFYLFYVNRKLADTPCLDEMLDLQKIHKRFTLIPVMTKDSTWQGEKGHVTKEMIARYLTDITKPLYYLTGPAAMADATWDMLEEAGVTTDNIRVDEFTGY